MERDITIIGSLAIGAAAGPGASAPATAEWLRAHRELQRISRARTRLDLEEGRWMLTARREEVHWRLGYGSFFEYAERILGHSPRATREKLRMAAALETLPEMAAAVAAGSLAYSAARELTRVATSETEREWLGAAQGQTLRQVERLVSGRQHGSRPGEMRDSAALRHTLRFELSGEAYATLREAMAKLRREAGGGLDDDAVLLQMARQVLGGSGEARASYQVAVSVCAECGRAEQEASGRQVALGPAAQAMVECDAQHIGAVAGARAERSERDDARVGSTGRSGGPAACVQRGDDHDVEHCDELHDQHDGEHAAARPTTHVGHDTERPTTHVGHDAAAARASQTIPPATRRLVMRRDHATCQVPGCQHALYCDVHHLTPRAEGGGHDPDGLLVLCSAHHRAVHDGRLVIEGRVSEGLRFHHADGTPYGAAPNPEHADAAAQVFVALRNLGFREREARSALRELASAHVGPPPSTAQLLRETLRQLTARALHAT